MRGRPGYARSSNCPTMRELRCLLVDDERLARVELAALLAEAGNCRIVGEAASVEAARVALRTQQPDVVFLDIQLPAADGFSLLNAPGIKLPPVVFVTAFDTYAVRAFAVQAVDYLLKPVSPRRLAATLERVRALIDATIEAEEPIYVEDKKGGRLVSIDELYLVRAYDHYVRLYHTEGTDLLRLPLRALERRLSNQTFFRCNRSAIVRISAVRKLSPLSRGRYRLYVGTTAEEVIVSEARAVQWRQRFGMP